MNKKLAIFGPYPPPLGGISVHIKRLESYLLKENIDYQIFNHGLQSQKNVKATKKRFYWYFKLLFIEKHKVFHFHQFFLFHFLYYLIFSYLRKEIIIVTIHSERILRYNNITKSLIIFLISKTKRLTLISVSKNLNDFLNQRGLRSILLPAYIPPTNINYKKIKSTKSIFLVSIWKFNHKLVKDIYNIPLAFDYLSKNKDDFTMLFMIGNKSDSDLNYLEKLIRKYGIAQNIKIIFNENLVDYIKNCKFILRPNLSDGYGVSIQEGLDLGVPAIASNVCERPKGTVLFKSNDIKDLSDKIEFVLNTPKGLLLSKKDNLAYHNQLIEIYLKKLNNETSNPKL